MAQTEGESQCCWMIALATSGVHLGSEADGKKREEEHNRTGDGDAHHVHMCTRAAVLLCCRAAVLLCCCAAVLPCCCAAVLLCCCAAVVPAGEAAVVAARSIS